MRRRGLWVAGGVLVLAAIVIWAWIDGGREPLREIAVEIPAPGAAQ